MCFCDEENHSNGTSTGTVPYLHRKYCTFHFSIISWESKKRMKLRIVPYI